MAYADVRPKKIFAIAAITLTIGLFVILTAAAWAHEVGTFSIPAVELAASNAFSTWQDRIQFNLQFGSGAAPGAAPLLAAIGITPPIAASQTVTPTQTTATAIPVLLYHGIVPVSTDPDETSIANFKAQMFTLKNAGWQTVSIEDFVAAMKGEKVLPPKSFLLTFDDGRQDAYYNATPILQALGYQAIMYVITGHSLATGNEKSKYYVTEDQLQQMLSSGVWELQSHSDIGHSQYPVNASGGLGDFFGSELYIPKQDPGESSSTYAARVYTDLETYFTTGQVWSLADSRPETTQEYQARIAEDLANAKNMLAQKLGVDAISFAYPYNDFAQDLANDSTNGTPALINFVNQIYDVSFYQWYASLGFSEDYPGADGQLLKRIEPKPDWTPTYLLSLLNNGQPKLLPYALPANAPDQSWIDAWGDVSKSDGTITLSASSTTVGASTILDGSRLWNNYDYEMQMNWQTASSISLFSRYVASPLGINYIACNFGNGSVRLESHENGTTTVIAEKNDQSIGPGDGKNPGTRLAGNYAECLWNGAVITGGYLPASTPTSGGIGLEIWDSQLGIANATVSGVSVQGVGQ